MPKARASKKRKVQPEPITYDTDGDLILRVAEAIEGLPKSYTVCSKAISRASKVFKTMLFGGFAESRPSGPASQWIVDLPEDESEPFEIFLSIIHGRFDLMPTIMSLTQLYNLLTVTEKYDATTITRPWARSWIDQVKTQTDNPYLLCVAWEMGDEELFELMVAKITDEAIVNESGHLLFGGQRMRWTGYSNTKGPHTFPLQNIVYLMPEGLIDAIKVYRERFVAAGIQPYADLYNHVKTKNLCENGGYYSSDDKMRCDSLILGSLVKECHIASIDISAPHPATAYCGSLAGWTKAAKDMKLLTDHHHRDCKGSKRISETKEAALAAMEKAKGNIVIVQERHKAYLKKQAKKTGLA